MQERFQQSLTYGVKSDLSQGRRLRSLKIASMVSGFPLRDLKAFAAKTLAACLRRFLSHGLPGMKGSGACAYGKVSTANVFIHMHCPAPLGSKIMQWSHYSFEKQK